MRKVKPKQPKIDSITQVKIHLNENIDFCEWALKTTAAFYKSKTDPKTDDAILILKELQERYLAAKKTAYEQILKFVNEIDNK